jgi:hypothetical protein
MLNNSINFVFELVSSRLADLKLPFSDFERDFINTNKKSFDG